MVNGNEIKIIDSLYTYSSIVINQSIIIIEQHFSALFIFHICQDHCRCNCLQECVQGLGGQPYPDHRVHHGLPHPQVGVPGHHYLRSGHGHRHLGQGPQAAVRCLVEEEEY